MTFYKQKQILILKILERLESEDKGILTIEFSIIFTISVFVTIVVLDLFALMYQRTSEIVENNKLVLEKFQTSDFDVENYNFHKGNMIENINKKYLRKRY